MFSVVICAAIFQNLMYQQNSVIRLACICIVIIPYSADQMGCTMSFIVLQICLSFNEYFFY